MTGWRVEVTLEPGGCLLWLLLVLVAIGLVGDVLRALS